MAKANNKDSADRDRRWNANIPTITRASGSDGPGKIGGIAAPYYDGRDGTEYQLWRDTYERYAPGAFADAIAGQNDVRALKNHDDSILLGRTTSGTLRLWDSPEGLRYEVDLPDTTGGRDVAIEIQRGDMTGSSIGFTVLEEKWESRSDGAEVRTILKAKLWDVSPVTYPAYAATQVSTRSQQEIERHAVDSSSEIELALAEIEVLEMGA
jgi:uncharacterized protein